MQMVQMIQSIPVFAPDPLDVDSSSRCELLDPAFRIFNQLIGLNIWIQYLIINRFVCSVNRQIGFPHIDFQMKAEFVLLQLTVSDNIICSPITSQSTRTGMRTPHGSRLKMSDRV